MGQPGARILRPCGKPYADEEEARRSKKGRLPGAVFEQCPRGDCDAVHIRFPAEAPARALQSPRTRRLRPRSPKTARQYVTRRAIVAELFAEPSICEVPWCTERATDPHEPLTRARGGDILDRSNIRLVCHPHNAMFASDEQPWMYELGFLVHSWDAPGGAA